jgi:hypothetical protein
MRESLGSPFFIQVRPQRMHQTRYHGCKCEKKRGNMKALLEFVNFGKTLFLNHLDLN